MTIQEIAQWVIDNRYPKSEHEKVSDMEMYYKLSADLEIYAEAKAKEAFEAARGIDYNGTNEYYFADYEDYKTTS